MPCKNTDPVCWPMPHIPFHMDHAEVTVEETPCTGIASGNVHNMPNGFFQAGGEGSFGDDILPL